MTPQEANREIALLKQELQNTRQAKNHQAIQLKHALSRAQIKIKALEERCTLLEAEAKSAKQRYRQLQLYAKERSQAIAQKDYRISQLQEAVQFAVKEKQDEMKAYDCIDKLMELIQSQEQELSMYLSDHQNYVEYFQKTAANYQELNSERNLLADYNTELEKQIQEVQTAKSSLEGWVSSAYSQIKSQNEQAGDLLSQLEYVMETIAPQNA